MREQVQKPENTSHTIQSNSKASKQAPISEILQAYKDRIDGKPVQRQSVDEEELLQTKAAQQDYIKAVLQQYKERSIQRHAPEEDEELIQGKFNTVQREEIDEEEISQGKFESISTNKQESVQREEKPNNTGLPDNLKTGIENLSGYSMDDVKVHYNSDKPAQLQALAYTQGTDIHVASGQEEHLTHEAWHVVQQKQGRVQPTTQLQGVNVNDNEGLEKEADVMGGKAVQKRETKRDHTKHSNCKQLVAQFVRILNIASGTNPEKFIRPKTEEDSIINLDRGDMLYTQIMLESFEKYIYYISDKINLDNGRIINADDIGEQIRREVIGNYINQYGIENAKHLIKVIDGEDILNEREEQLRSQGLTICDIFYYSSDEKFDRIIMVSGHGLKVLERELLTKIAGLLKTNGLLIISGNEAVLKQNGIRIKRDSESGSATATIPEEAMRYFKLCHWDYDDIKKRKESQHTVGGDFSDKDKFHTFTLVKN
jgi:hypothetical protein